MTREEEIYRRAQENVERITETLSLSSVARKFGTHITVGPSITRAIVSNMIENFEVPEGQASIDVIVTHMMVILAAEVRLELRFVEARDDAHGTVYPFGFESTALAFPISALRCDPAAIACIKRFQTAGEADGGGMPAFFNIITSSDTTKTTYARFANNAILGDAMCRTSLLAAYVTVFAATSYEVQARSESKSHNEIEHARVLMKDCLERVAQRLGKICDSSSTRTPPSVTMLMRRQVRGLIECCEQNEFNSETLSSKILLFAKERFAAKAALATK